MLSACLVDSISKMFLKSKHFFLFPFTDQGLYNYHCPLGLMHYSSQYSALKSLVTSRMRSFLTSIFRCRPSHHEPFSASFPCFIYFNETIPTRDYIFYSLVHLFIVYIPNGIWVHWGHFQCPEQLLTDNNCSHINCWINIWGGGAPWWRSG